MTEKQWLEKSLMDYFIDSMNKMHGLYYSIVAHKDRPDFIVKEKKQNKKFGVEVTNLYYDSEDAREIFGRGIMTNSKVENIEHYVFILNQLLDKKAHKSKGYDPNLDLILLIGVTSMLFDRNDFENSIPDIFIPESKFSIICLVFFNNFNKNWEDLMFIKHEAPHFHPAIEI